MATPSVPGEIADVLVNVLESAPVQASLLAAVTAGEVGFQSLVDTTIANLKGTGVLGIVITAAKGTVETEVNAEIAQYTPQQIVTFITKMAQDEAKNLGG